jgi:hypothetical protein
LRLWKNAQLVVLVGQLAREPRKRIRVKPSPSEKLSCFEIWQDGIERSLRSTRFIHDLSGVAIGGLMCPKSANQLNWQLNWL